MTSVISKLHAGAYRLPDRVLIHPVAISDVGVGLAIPPVTIHVGAVAPAELGGSIRLALEQSAVVIPHPAKAELTSFGRKFLAAARLRSWRALES